MNNVKDKRSSREKSCQVEKGHSSQRFLKSHVERKYFKGKSRNASRKKYEKLENQKNIELINFKFSLPATFIDLPDLDVKICTKITEMVTEVQEISNNLIVYFHPLFGAKAFVEIPSLTIGTNIQIGWIQVCTEGKCATFHEGSIYSLEIPELVTGKYSMFLDSDQYSSPWYDVKSVITRKGPAPPYTATIYMKDTPGGNTTLCKPTAGNTSTPSLTYIYRKQNFLTYLVIKNMEKNTYEIIKCISWKCEAAIELDPGKKLGERVVFVGPCSIEQPKLLSIENTPPLEKNIFDNVSASDCILLANRSKYKKSEIESLPDETTVNMDTYIDETESFTSELLKVTKRNFLLNYKKKAK